MLTDAVRSLRRSPGTTAFILFILTITIAAATVTFSVVDAVVLRPLPFDAPEELVTIEHERGDGLMARVRAMAAVQYLALAGGADAFSALAAVPHGLTPVQIAGDPESALAATATASLFDVLGVGPFIGRTFTAAHETAGNDRVAVIGHRLWTRRFGSDPAIVGRAIAVGDRSLVVLGVMPEGFSYPVYDDRVVDIWVPYVIPGDERVAPRSLSYYLDVVGRLRPGASLVQAQAQADGIRRTFVEKDRERYAPAGRFVVTPLTDTIVGPVRGWMVLVLVAVSLLLVVACANAANLLLTRAIDRARELSIRAALGATRRRLVASLFVESVVLAGCGVVLALLVATWGVQAAKGSLPPGIARANLIALNGRVFAAAVAGAFATSLLFGLIPAFQAARADVAGFLKHGSASVTARGSRWRRLVLVAEIALTSVLLVATTLFVSSFIRLTRADLGFDRSRLLVVTSAGQGLEGRVADFARRIESLPGVTAVGGAAAGSPPLVAAGFSGGSSATALRLPDAPAGAAPVIVEFNRVSPGYFRAAGIPLLRGRGFSDADLTMTMRTLPTVIVLDEVAARQLFGDRDPVGREVSHAGGRRTIVGVVANVRMRGPEADSGPQAYLPGATPASSYAYLIRTSRPAADIAPDLHAAIAALRPSGSRPAQIRLVEDAFRNITARRRFSAGAMAIFGVLALLIGASGVYGVMSSLVTQRTREIGLRMALGATRRRMLGAVVAQMGRSVALGLAAGLPIAWLVSRAFASQFFQVRPSDPWIYAAVGGILGAVGVAAAFVPARRASLVDPLVALRSE
jgi:predicted permease